MKEILEELWYGIDIYLPGWTKDFLFVLLLILLIATCSCTRVQYVPKVKIDSVYIHNTQKDSVYVQDSVIIREKGDTVFIRETRFKYINRLSSDTVYKTRIDSIPYPVEKQLSWKEMQYIKVGKFVLGVGVLVVIGICIRLCLKFLR